MLRFLRRLPRNVLVLPAAMLIVSTGAIAPACGGDRSDLPLEKAIVGHWRTHSGKAEYYFAADGKLLMVEQAGKERQAQTYEVVGTDEDEEVLRVKIKVVSTGRGHEKELRFATDRRSLMSTIRTTVGTDTFVINTTWHYVDDDETPPEDKADR